MTNTSTGLRILSAIALSSGLLASSAQASKSLSGDMCVFETSSAVYGGGPPEKMTISWNRATGRVSSFSWYHGGAVWYSYAANPGTVQPEDASAYYLLANIGITTAGYDSTRYSLKGYISINVDWPDATLAMIYEGTGTAAMVASGKVSCK